MFYYINEIADSAGSHGPMHTVGAPGRVSVPEEMREQYIAAKGFVTLTVDAGRVIGMAVNTEALAAYEADHPETAPVPTLAERVEALEQGGVAGGESGLTGRVEALEEAVQSLPGSDSGLSGRVEALEDSVSALTDTVNGLPTGGGEGGGDAETVYNEMAAAYREGVQSA